MSRRHRYKKLHAIDLVNKAMDGDAVATEELIDRQQSGRDLRLYPNGRKGPDDEGICPISIRVHKGCVSIRSGRPSRSLIFNKEQAFLWVFGMAECMSHVISKHVKSGLSENATGLAINSKSTPGFSCDVAVGNDSIHCTFYPKGAPAWIASVEGAAEFIQKVMVAASSLGWETDATDEEIMMVKPFLSGVTVLGINEDDE